MSRNLLFLESLVRGPWPLAVLLVLVLGGALIAPASPLGEPSRIGAEAAGAARREAAADQVGDCADPCVGVNLALPPWGSGGDGFGASPTFWVNSTGFVGAEPSIGVSTNGQTVYIQSGAKTVRSTNGGTTWTQIAPIPLDILAAVTLDPMLYYDPVIDRLYLNHLTAECSWLAWTDTPSTVGTGLTAITAWKVTPHACGTPVLDHQILEGGPSPVLGGAANEGRTLYMAYSHVGTGGHVAKSVDGGFVWTDAVAADPLQKGSPVWPMGFPGADPAGTYVFAPWQTPIPNLVTLVHGAGVKVAVSDTEGLAYTKVRSLAGHTAKAGSTVTPEAAVDEAGNAYVVWYNGANHKLYYKYSTDHGDTWLSASGFEITAADPSIQSTVFPAVAAKSSGKFVVAFYGTKDSADGPDGCTPAVCKWYLFLAQVTDATTATPTIAITQVTPDSDPIQIGKVCTFGINCEGGRNHLDFIDAKVDGDGRAHITYTDGCVAPCDNTSTAQSGSQVNKYARQNSGPFI